MTGLQALWMLEHGSTAANQQLYVTILTGCLKVLLAAMMTGCQLMKEKPFVQLDQSVLQTWKHVSEFVKELLTVEVLTGMILNSSKMVSL